MFFSPKGDLQTSSKDGFFACDDCDDTNAAVFPGATEICDGLDNDCDGLEEGASCNDLLTSVAAGFDFLVEDNTITYTPLNYPNAIWSSGNSPMRALTRQAVPVMKPFKLKSGKAIGLKPA